MPDQRNESSAAHPAARIGREREDEPMRSSGQLGELEQIGLCPDCGRPVESHSMFKDGRCPVVRFEPRGVEMASESAATFRPPYRYEASEHGPVTIYDSVDVGWIARVKESLPHKEALAAAMVDGLNAAAGRMTERQGARLLTGGSGDESDAGSIPAPSVDLDAVADPSAAQSYDYGRIIALLQRIRLCANTVDKTLPERTLDGNLRARNYAAQIGTDVRELEELLLERHLTIQREAESRV